MTEEVGDVGTVRLTVSQALVRFLANQYSERDGVQQRLIPGCWGIFGHGNVAGVGQALLEAHTTGSADLPYYLARNEQGMVHASVGYSRMRNRLQTMACTASRCCCWPATSSPPGWAAPCSRSWSCRAATTCRSTTPSGRCHGSSTGS